MAMENLRGTSKMKTSQEIEPDALSSISLFLRGDNMRHSFVTKALGCAPDRFWQRGEEKASKSGAITVRKTGFWCISQVNKNTRLNESVESLLARLRTTKNLFSIIEDLEEAELSIFLAQDCRENEGGKLSIFFPASTLKTIANLGVELSFDISFIAEPSAVR